MSALVNGNQQCKKPLTLIDTADRSYLVIVVFSMSPAVDR